MKADGTPEFIDPDKNDQARAKINLSISTSCYVHVRTAKTAKETWDNLKSAFESSGLSRRRKLLCAPFGVKASNFNNLKFYVNQVMTYHLQLIDIGYPLDDEFAAEILLSGLPEQYDPLVILLEASNTKLTTEMVKNKLLDEQLRKNEMLVQCKVENLALSTASKNKKQVKGKKYIFRCLRCHEEGHKSSECPEKKSNDDKKNVQSSRKSEWNMLTAMAVKWILQQRAACLLMMIGYKTENKDHLLK